MAFRVFAGGILVGYDVFLELLHQQHPPRRRDTLSGPAAPMLPSHASKPRTPGPQ
jgi:hypothetical protein